MRVLLPTEITDEEFVSSTATEPDAAFDETTWSALTEYEIGDKIVVAHRVLESLRGEKAVLTSISNTAPAVFTLADHGKEAGQPFTLDNTGGALPTPFVEGQQYFMVNVADNTFQASLVPPSSPGWAPIAATGAGSGTHTIVYSANLNRDPTDPDNLNVYWFDTEEPSNQWAALDNLTDTATRLASPLTFVLEPGLISGWALIGLVGKQAQVSISVGGSPVYTKTLSLDGSYMTDGDWSYWFAPFNQKRVVHDLDITPYDGQIAVTVTGPGEVAIGALLVGLTHEIGTLLEGAESGYISYTTAETNTQGRTRLNKRRSVPTINGTLLVDKRDVNRVSDLSVDLDGVLAFYAGTDDDQFAPLAVLGFPTQFKGQHRVTDSLFALTVKGF